jgi:hypothetical protein
MVLAPGTENPFFGAASGLCGRFAKGAVREFTMFSMS